MLTSSFYRVKLLEDLPDDDHVSHRTEWYSKDRVHLLLFTTTGNEDIASRDGIKGMVQNVKYVVDDTIKIKENDYYIYLTSLYYSLEDNVLPQEEPDLTQLR